MLENDLAVRRICDRLWVAVVVGECHSEVEAFFVIEDVVRVEVLVVDCREHVDIFLVHHNIYFLTRIRDHKEKDKDGAERTHD